MKLDVDTKEVFPGTPPFLYIKTIQRWAVCGGQVFICHLHGWQQCWTGQSPAFM